jgi:hypothetical protein
MKLSNQNIYNLWGCKKLWGAVPNASGGVQIISAVVCTPQKIRAWRHMSLLCAHTDRTRFGNATRIFSFQKQIERQRIKILQDMQTK